MKSFDEIKEHYRISELESGDDGLIGQITFPHWQGTIIVSDGGGWNHVSVSPYKKSYTPTWEDMCAVKDICFRDDESVVQIHPPKSEYVNNMPNCLHLWQIKDREMEMPPSIMVGIRNGQTRASVMEEAKGALGDG